MEADWLQGPQRSGTWVHRKLVSQEAAQTSSPSAILAGVVGVALLVLLAAVIASYHFRYRRARIVKATKGLITQGQSIQRDPEAGKRKACIEPFSVASTRQRLVRMSSIEMFWRAFTAQQLPPVRLRKERLSPPPSGCTQMADSATSVMARAHACAFKGTSLLRGRSHDLTSLQDVEQQTESVRVPESAVGGLPISSIPTPFAKEEQGVAVPVSSSTCEQPVWGRGASAASIRTLDSVWEMSSWELDPDEVQLSRDSKGRPVTLGVGGFGKVYKAEMAGSTPVAVKYVTRQSPRELRRFAHEIGILKSLRHTNIVQFMGAYLEGEQIVLVTEYMKGGDLHHVIGCDLNRDFGWYKRGQHVALDVVRGLVHMHARKIIHLDIKSANILLARDGTAKIADVGLAKVLSREITRVSTESTFDWAAPEVLAGFECSEKADIWSLGVVLWEVITGESPHLRQLRPIRVPQECPQEVKDVVSQCRASDPANRPSARQVFASLFQAVQLAKRRDDGGTTSINDGADFGQESFPLWGAPECQQQGAQEFLPRCKIAGPGCLQGSTARRLRRYPIRLLPGMSLPYEEGEQVEYGQTWHLIPL